MNFLKFLISKRFLKNLLIAFIAGVFILAGAFIWLRIYTRHGQKITVPDLSGLMPEEVKIITDSKSLRFEVIDTIFNDNIPRGAVANQNPIPGSKVKQNRRIYLTLNAVNPEKVTMPAVTGVSLRQARAILETHGLNLGTISYKPDIAVNVVLEQRFGDTVAQTGMIINKGSEVDLVLGKGLSNETTEVPDLSGFNLNIAKQFLADRFLNIGAVIFDNSIENTEDSVFAFIWKQKPEYNLENRLKLGENVDIWLTVDSTKLPAYDTIMFNDEDFDYDISGN